MGTLTDNLDENLLPSKVDEFLCQYLDGSGGDAVYIRMNTSD